MEPTRRTFPVMAIALISAAWAAASAQMPPAPKEKTPNPFFAMDTATNRQLPPDAQAALVKELGYDGIGCDIRQLPDMIHAADKAGIRLFSVYVGANVDPAKPAYDPNLKDAVQWLKGRETILWLFVTGAKPGALEHDGRAAAVVREVADLAAAAGLRVALYPHFGFYVQSVEDALRVREKADRKNVGVTFNLCHFLRADREENLEAVLRKAAPHLYLVSINGADRGGKDWTTLIQTLDRGTFDNVRLLKLLHSLGYTGPIGFQGYGIKGEPREILSRTMDGWRKILAAAGPPTP